MTRKIATTKTAAERRAEMAALHATIATQVDALHASQAWTQFLDFAGAFHHYSLSNLFLILAQMPAATQVAGYRTWQKLGRQVRKGERGIRILGGRRVSVTVTNAAGEDEDKERLCFFPVSVFDKSQTDLIDPEAGDPSELAHQLNGEDALGIFGAVADFLTERGWSVTREAFAGGANGYTTNDGTKQIVVRDDLADAQAAKTLLHEAAHALLHAESEDPADYLAHRGLAETEAESVAYVVAGALGVDTAAYSIGYVAGWSECDTELIKSTATRVLSAAHTILAAITE